MIIVMMACTYIIINKIDIRKDNDVRMIIMTVEMITVIPG